MVCPKCGATIEDGATSCPYCGEVFNAPQAAPQGDPNPIQGERPQPRVEYTGNDHTAEFTEADRANNHVLGLVCYMGLYLLIPVLTVKNSKFIKFHANQGIGILLGYIAIQVINFVISLIFNVLAAVVGGGGVISGSDTAAAVGIGIFGILGLLWGLLYSALFLFLFVLQIIGMVTAAQGKAKSLPLVKRCRFIKY
jgi:uncharacterized Tic20 family protein